MNTTSKTTTALLLCGAISLAGLAGCSAGQGKMPTSRNNTTPDDSGFAAGAERAPTAATSYSFAKILIAQGRDRDAIYVLARIVREHPKFIPAYNELASVYVRADRLDDAIDTIETGLKHSPRDPVL